MLEVKPFEFKHDGKTLKYDSLRNQTVLAITFVNCIKIIWNMKLLVILNIFINLRQSIRWDQK